MEPGSTVLGLNLKARLQMFRKLGYRICSRRLWSPTMENSRCVQELCQVLFWCGSVWWWLFTPWHPCVVEAEVCAGTECIIYAKDMDAVQDTPPPHSNSQWKVWAGNRFSFRGIRHAEIHTISVIWIKSGIKKEDGWTNHSQKLPVRSKSGSFISRISSTKASHPTGWNASAGPRKLPETVLG